MESSLAEKNRVVGLGKVLNMIHRGCIIRKVATRSRFGIIPFSLGLIRPHLEYYVQIWTLQNVKIKKKKEKATYRCKSSLLPI